MLQDFSDLVTRALYEYLEKNYPGLIDQIVQEIRSNKFKLPEPARRSPMKPVDAGKEIELSLKSALRQADKAHGVSPTPSAPKSRRS